MNIKMITNKKIAFVALTILVSLLSGCVGVRNREKVCTGMLEMGIYRDAFQEVWGLPTRTSVMTGDKITEANFGGNGAGFQGGYFKGRRSYEVWTYENRGVILVFDRGERLVAWSTNKTVQEIGASAPAGVCK